MNRPAKEEECVWATWDGGAKEKGKNKQKNQSRPYV